MALIGNKLSSAYDYENFVSSKNGTVYTTHFLVKRKSISQIAAKSEKQATIDSSLSDASSVTISKTDWPKYARNVTAKTASCTISTRKSDFNSSYIQKNLSGLKRDINSELDKSSLSIQENLNKKDIDEHNRLYSAKTRSKAEKFSTRSYNVLPIQSRDNIFNASFSVKHRSRLLNKFPVIRKPYTAPLPTKTVPFIPPPPRTANVIAAHQERLATLKSKLRKPHEVDPPEIPAELEYETRPISAHARFKLEDHVAPSTMFVEKEVDEDYEKKMRSLFLPSLFAGDGVEDSKKPSSRNTATANGKILGGNNGTTVKAVSFQDSRSIKTAPASVFDTQDGKRPQSGNKNQANSRTQMPRPPSGGAKVVRTSSARVRSAKKRFVGFSNLSEKSTAANTSTSFSQKALIRRSLATINTSNVELPPDISLISLRWSQALYYVLKMGKFKKSVLDDSFSIENESPEMMMSHSKHDKVDLIGALQVKKIYEINVANRTDKDLDTLDAILGKYRCFSKLSPVVRYKLYNCCTVESHSRGTVMIREGHQARYWYIILTGECLHQLRPDTPMSITTRVQIGGSIGDFAPLYVAGSNGTETRHIRATCLMRCEFLRVEKQDYVAISREARGLDTMVFEYFTTVPQFFGVDKNILHQLCQRSIVRKFDADQIMLRAGEFCSNLYFVVRGKVRALHMVTFIKLDNPPTPSRNGFDRRHRYTLVPFNSLQISKLGPTDEMVRELATVLDITNGMSFPPMKPSKVVLEQQEAAATIEYKPTNGKKTPTQIQKPNSMDPHALQSPFHFVVVDKVEVVAISTADLIEILPPDTLRRVMEHRTMTDVSTQEIEERYLSALGWRESENSGKKVLKIENFSSDKSWSHPVVKNKFKDGADDLEDPFGLKKTHQQHIAKYAAHFDQKISSAENNEKLKLSNQNSNHFAIALE